MKNLLTQAKWIITITLLALLGLFAAQNTKTVDLTFLVWTFESRRIVVISISLLAGLAVGFLFGLSVKRWR